MAQRTLLLFFLLIPLATAQSSTGYLPANSAGCKVWTPLQLHAPDYVPKYTGGCANGVAQGKGELRWMYNDPSITRPKTTWQGFFQDGVYVGDTPLAKLVEPQPRSNDYWVHLGAVSGGDILVVAQANNDGMMDLCAPSFLYVSLTPKVQPTDDAAVRQLMTDAGSRLQAACPSMRHNATQVNVYSQPFKLNPDRTRPQPTADANLNWSNMTLSGYSNRASNALKTQQNTVQRDTRLAESRKRFDDFTSRNHVTTWVTLTQLDENPFKYEGKVVGVIVQLDRMLTPDTALVNGGLEDDGGSVQLHGISPEFPDHTHAVLVAGRVGKREPVAGTNSRALVTPIARLDSATCARDACYDWLDWTRGEDRIHWGDPYSATH